MPGTITNVPPEPRASRFIVIHRAPFSLGDGEEHHKAKFDFFFSRRVWVDEDIVISFMLIRADDLKLGVAINSEAESYVWDYQPGPERLVHKVVKGIGHEGINTLKFGVFRGSCRISDVVLWYYVDE